MIGIGLFLQALAGGLLLALLSLLAWRLAQRIELLRPRHKAARRKLLCVRPLDFDA